MVERGWDKQMPSDIAKSIVIEAAELLEYFQWSDSTKEKVEKDPRFRGEILDELADVFIYAMHMAQVLDCDAEDIIRKKLAKAALKYPAPVVKKNFTLKKRNAIRRAYKATA